MISNGKIGFSIAQSATGDTVTVNGSPVEVTDTVTVYDANGNKQSVLTDLDGICPRDVILSNGRRVILTTAVDTTPEQGINPAHSTYTLHEYDATNGTPLWQTTLDHDAPNPCDLAPVDHRGYVDYIDNMTSNGSAIALASGWLNLVDGKIAGESYGALQPLGSYLASPNPNSDPPTLIDPQTGELVHTEFDYPLDRILYADDDSAVGQFSNDGSLERVSLQNGKVMWTSALNSSETDADYTYGLTSGSAFVSQSHALLGVLIGARSYETGNYLWSNSFATTLGPGQAFTAFCGAAQGKILLSTGTQLAILDATTGKQLSFDPNRADCPTIYENGIAVFSDSGTDAPATIVQYL